MRSIITFFIDRSFIVNLASLAVIVVGLALVPEINRNLVPKVTMHTIQVDASIPGASPETMEQEVTFPIETAIRSLPDVKTLYSSTGKGTTSLSVNLQRNGKKPDDVLETIRARLDSLKASLPSSLENIESNVVKTDVFNAMGFSLIPFDTKNPDHYFWLDAFKKDLQKLDLIVKVESYEPKRHLYINLKPKRIADFGLTVQTVQQKIRSFLNPAPLGSIQKQGRQIIINMKKVDLKSDVISSLPIQVTRFGKEVKLGDVATVEFRTDRFSRVNPVNGHPGVYIQPYADNDQDYIILTDAIRERVEAFKKRLPPPLQIIEHYASGDFISHQFSVLKSNAALGSIMVLIILAIFLGVRPALMTACGLPIAYLGTLIGLHYFEVTFNLFSIMAMIIIVGILVDDAIIVTERYMDQLGQGQTPRQAAIDSAYSLVAPVTGTILTTIVAFSPILIIDSELRDWFFAVPVVIICALLFSWLECFFVLPNHMAHFVSQNRAIGRGFMSFLTRIYSSFLRYVLKLRYLVFVSILGFLAFSGSFLMSHLKILFDLSFGAGSHRVVLQLTESDSLDTMVEKTKDLEAFLLSINESYPVDVIFEPGKANINGKFKRGYDYGQFNIYVKGVSNDQRRTTEVIRTMIEDGLKNFRTDKYKQLTLLGKQGQGGQSTGADTVTVRVKAQETPNYEGLKSKIKELMTGTKGLKNIMLNDELFVDAWQFEPNHRILASYALSPGEVSTQLAPNFSPVKIGYARYQGKQVDIYSETLKADELEFEDLGNLRVTTPRETVIKTKRIGRWTQLKQESQIEHRDGMRLFSADILYDSQKTDLIKFKDAVRQKLEPLKSFFPEYDIDVASTDEKQDEAQEWILKVVGISVFLILLILAFTLGSLTQPLMVLTSVPMGFFGVGWAFYLHGYEIGLIGLVGLLGVGGVAVNDSLIMVYAMNRLRSTKQHHGGEAIIEAASGRLRAISLTTITALAGVFPMAYGIGGDAGYTRDIAFAMGWGLLSSTLATLLFLPTLAAIREDFVNLFLKIKRKVA